MRKSGSERTKTAPLLHLFNRDKASTVRFEEGVLTVWAKPGRIAQSLKADQIQKATRHPRTPPDHGPLQELHLRSPQVPNLKPS